MRSSEAKLVVPSVDSADNSYISDVIGNKSDTSGGTSLMALLKYVATDAANAAIDAGTAASAAQAVSAEVNFIEQGVSTAKAVMVDGSPVFTVSNGRVRLIALYALCNTANDATASTLKYVATPTVGAPFDLSAASASLASATVGTVVVWMGTPLSTALTIYADGGGAEGSGTAIVPPGTIDLEIGVGSTTGEWYQFLVYQPLEMSATVSAY